MDNSVYNPAIPIQSAPGFDAFGELINFSEEFRKSIDPDLCATSGSVQVSDLYLPHFSLRKIEAEFSRDITIYNDISTNQKATPGFGMFYHGSFRLNRKGDRKSFTMSKGEQNFLFDPCAEMVTNIKANTYLSGVLIAVDPQYFDSLLPDDEKWSDALRRQMHNNEVALGLRNASISADQYAALYQVFNNPLTGKLKLQMQEAVLCQLLIQNLHSSFHTPGETSTRIGTRDRELMKSVRDHLTKTFAEEHSLQALARHFGINQNKLTSTFRQMFGVSIFDYLSSLKMDYAKSLLERDGLRVKEIATLIGYKNPHHFTAAFRRRFGHTPKQLKGRRIR